MYASHLNQCSGSGISVARAGTSASGRARHRGPPELARDPVLRVACLRRPQREVEPDEVERRADPGDARDDVQHPQADVEDVSQVRVHLFLAMATSSVQAVSSSSSRVRAIRVRARRGSRASGVRRRRRRTGTRTSPRRPGSGTPARSGRRAPLPVPCSAAERAESPARRSRDARRGPRACPRGSGSRTWSAGSERVLDLRQALDEGVRPSKRSASSSTVSFRGSWRTRTGETRSGTW